MVVVLLGIAECLNDDDEHALSGVMWWTKDDEPVCGGASCICGAAAADKIRSCVTQFILCLFYDIG